MTEADEARNHALWLSPILAVVGFVSYYAFFAQYPVFRDHPWVNLLILSGAIALAVVGFRRTSGGWRRAAAVAGVLVSVGLTALLLFYSYSMSYSLPSADLAAEAGERIPSIALASTDGGVLDLAEAGSEKLVLVFYRGFW